MNGKKKTSNSLEFYVTKKKGTEPPFQNQYWDHYERGIYVDVTTGEPLFLSSKKFNSGCGWPSFSEPIDPHFLKEESDTSYGMTRTEVTSTSSGNHLGHVFNDGPQDMGGLRYCINSASLRFVPENEMETEGYGVYLPLIK